LGKELGRIKFMIIYLLLLCSKWSMLYFCSWKSSFYQLHNEKNAHYKT
jgi:hypothetical protein